MLTKDDLLGLAVVALMGVAIFGLFIPPLIRGLALGVGIAAMWTRGRKAQ